MAWGIGAGIGGDEFFLGAAAFGLLGPLNRRQSRGLLRASGSIHETAQCNSIIAHSLAASYRLPRLVSTGLDKDQPGNLLETAAYGLEDQDRRQP